MKTCVCLLAVAVGAPMVVGEAPETRSVESVRVCRLQADPRAFNHKLVEVAGVVSHGFENFTLSDSTCGKQASIWLEYGGTINSETVMCCGITAGSQRNGVLTVEGVSLPLVDDAMFRRLHTRIHKDGDVTFRATLQGHFFAGARQTVNGTVFWSGYGHLGMFSLFVIQKVVALEDVAQ